MSLNAYRDEAGRFLEAIGATEEPVEKKFSLLQRELDRLKSDANNAEAAGHQVYDLLFILFEIASQYNVDLDAAWLAGRLRKNRKYL